MKKRCPLCEGTITGEDCARIFFGAENGYLPKGRNEIPLGIATIRRKRMRCLACSGTEGQPLIDYYAYSDKETFVRTETSSHGCRIAVIIKEIPEWKTYNGESAFAQMILQQIYDGALESAWQADVDREVCTWKIRAKKKAPHRRMSEEEIRRRLSGRALECRMLEED